jgi:hypothetical protein
MAAAVNAVWQGVRQCVNVAITAPPTGLQTQLGEGKNERRP